MLANFVVLCLFVYYVVFLILKRDCWEMQAVDQLSALLIELFNGQGSVHHKMWLFVARFRYQLEGILCWGSGGLGWKKRIHACLVSIFYQVKFAGLWTMKLQTIEGGSTRLGAGVLRLTRKISGSTHGIMPKIEIGI